MAAAAEGLCVIYIMSLCLHGTGGAIMCAGCCEVGARMMEALLMGSQAAVHKATMGCVYGCGGGGGKGGMQVAERQAL